MPTFAAVALLVLRKDVAIEVKSREILSHDALLRGVVHRRVRVRARARGPDRRGCVGGDPVDRDRVCRDPRARPYVRA